MTSKDKNRKMHRETAKRLLDRMIERVKEVNDDGDYCYIIDRMVVFGSYANSDREMLSDLDVAIHLVKRYEKDDVHWNQARLRYRGSSELEMYDYPREEVLRAIRNRSGWISIHVIGRDAEQDAIIFGDRTIEIDLGAGE